MSVWTPESIRLLTRMWREGAMICRIADAVGVSPKAVSDKARRLELPRRASGKSYAERQPCRRIKRDVVIIRRECLRCRVWFDGDKVTFVCAGCKALPAWREGDGVQARLTGVRVSGCG